MGIGLRMSMVPRQTQSLEQNLELVQEQRQEWTQEQVHALRMTARMGMLQAIWGPEYGDEFNVDERCPTCWDTLKLEEILRGFTADPNDTQSTCPRCKLRFQPRLRGMQSQAGRVELAFFCEGQTLHALQGKENVPFSELVMTSYGRSALIHFGSLTAAFAKIGVTYTAEEEKRRGWQDRIVRFLGRVPDTLIAEIVGVCTNTVRKFRRDRGIAKFSRWESQEE